MDAFSLGIGFLAGFALTPWFWVALTVIGLSLCSLSSKEEGFWSLVFTAVLGLLLASKWPVIVVFLSTPVNLLATVVIYFIIGTLWSLFKWKMFVNDRYDVVIKSRDSFLTRRGFPLDYFNDQKNITPDLVREYNDHLAYRITGYSGIVSKDLSYEEINKRLTPAASYYKYSIVMWIAYWPFSSFWFIVSDMITKIASNIYNMVGGYFQNISNSKFDKL